MHAIQRANVTKWVALSEGAGGTIGWLTTNERKEAMWCAARPALPRRPLTPPLCARSFQLRDCLRVGNISLAKGFFSVKQEAAETIRAMRDELCRFSIITEPPKTLFGKVRCSPRRMPAQRANPPCFPCSRCAKHTRARWGVSTTTSRS